MTPVILMLTPVMPSPTGGGSPIRAAAILESLSRIGRVIVVHAECWGDTPDVADRSWCREIAAAVVVIQPHRLPALPAIVADALEAAGMGARVDAVYAFRHVLAPAAMTCRERFQARVALLDLDDDEGQMDEFLIGFRRAHGDLARAAELQAQAQRRRIMRAMLIPRFDRVYLANPRDVEAMRAQHPAARIDLLPNVVPVARTRPGITPDPSRMLFLGTLSYLPNEDGVGWFIRDVLPIIRQSDARLWLRVAGVGVPERLGPLLGSAGVDFVGPVPDVAPEYAAAGMLVVPLRAGSGTRIKILEAFRHGTPVVSTTIGAAGLSVVSGEHLLLADSPDQLAACCLRLAGDETVRRELSARASAWVDAHHSIDVMSRTLARAIAAGGTVAP